MAILECKDLTKYYDRALGLDHLSLQLEPGRIVGLLGPNGSGKTTLLKIANGLLTPSSGQLLIDGKAPGPDTRRLVSYLPERTYLFAGDVIPLAAHLSLGWISAYDAAPLRSYEAKERMLAEAVHDQQALIYCHDAHTLCTTVKRINRFYSKDALLTLG